MAGGASYANLHSITGGKSEREILQSLMVPDDVVFEKLSNEKAWLPEWKSLAKSIGVSSKAKSFAQVNDELWRVMLFSEFVYDLPVALPEKFKSVPLVAESAWAMLQPVLKNIRNNKTCEAIYVEKAELVEKQFNLEDEFRHETNLGEIATFSFEDNTYFRHFVALLNEGKWKEAEGVIKKNKENIWPQNNEERKKIWYLAENVIEIQSIVDTEEKIPAQSCTLVKVYTEKVYLADYYHRRYEMSYHQLITPGEDVETMTRLVRKMYRDYTAKWQKAFQKSIASWPIDGMARNSQLFEKKIAPLLKAKKKVALLMVDALRYELGNELEQSLAKRFSTEIQASCAFIPTTTQFGMAALLPEADGNISLKALDGKLVPHIKDYPLPNLQSRRDYLKEKLGDRCTIVKLENLLSCDKLETDLLVVTTNEIDSAGESLVLNALAAIGQSIQSLGKALTTLQNWGYEKTIIATDHGFMLFPDFLAGDNVPKPTGEWVLTKSRCLAGKGQKPEHARSFAPEELGFTADADQFLFLQQYAVFEKGLQFFHEGLSLQEAIVPIIEVTAAKSESSQSLEVVLTYRGKSKGSITTLRPMIELACHQEGMLGLEPVYIKLEALSDNKSVGVPLACDVINEMSKTAEVMPGSANKIPFEMEEEFEGFFEVIASDPVTGKIYTKISLSTNYL